MFQWFCFLADILGWLLFDNFTKKTHLITVPITIVDHREDGSWGFFSSNFLNKIKITNLEEAIANDSSVEEIRDLPLGFFAKRKTTNSKWMRYSKSR